MRHITYMLVSLAIAPIASSPAYAQIKTGNFTVQITIQEECELTSATDLDFGTHGILSAALTANSAITVQCTSGTDYDLALDAGIGAGATVAARKMTNAGQTVTYALYQDSALTTIWGDSAGETVAGTGDGNPQLYPVYGQVPPQTTPLPGTYTDTITVTLSY